MARERGLLSALSGAAQGTSVEKAVVAAPKVKPKAHVERSRDSEDRPRAIAGARRQRGEGSANPHRVNKANVTGYFPLAVKQALRVIQAKYPEKRTEQDLLAEALNLLFAKEGMPEIAKLNS